MCGVRSFDLGEERVVWFDARHAEAIAAATPSGTLRVARGPIALHSGHVTTKI
jgi:hypothetical protein